MAIQEGQKAPAFTLADDEGKAVSLSDFKGKTVVLYFYPKDDTPGCTTEACSFRDELKDFFPSEHRDPGHQSGFFRFAQKIQNKILVEFSPAQRCGQKSSRSLWRLERKIHVRPQVHGRRTLDLHYRRAGKDQKIFPKVKVTGHTADLAALKGSGNGDRGRP